MTRGIGHATSSNVSTQLNYTQQLFKATAALDNMLMITTVIMSMFDQSYFTLPSGLKCFHVNDIIIEYGYKTPCQLSVKLA